MKQVMKLGVTDRTVTVFIPDPASTDGSGKTGLVAANLTVSYTRVETDNDVTVTDATSSLNDLSALTDAHNDWGLKEVSSTLAPGLYRLDIADAVFAAGAWSAVVYVMITSSAAAASPMEFILVAYDQLDGVRLGLTALPNAAADGAGGLPISDAGGLDLDAKIGALTFGTANRVNAQVYGMEANTVTATAIASDAITDAKVASDVTIASVTGAVGSVTGNVGGNVTGSVGSIATGGIAAASFAAGAIDAAAIATDAIDADALKADAVTEIQSGLSTLTAAGVRTAIGLASANLDTQLAAIDAVTDKVDTTLQDDGGSPTRYQFTTDALENAPSGSGASAADIADAVWDEATAGHQTAGSTGKALTDSQSAGNPWESTLEGSYTASDLLRVCAAVAAGKTDITSNGNNAATVVFRDVTDSSDIVEAEMAGSERASVTLNP